MTKELDEIRAAGLEVAKVYQRLRNFFELFDDLLCEANENGFFEWVNANWEKYLGWTFEEMTSRPWLEFVHPDDIDNTVAAAKNMKVAGVINFENRYKNKRGEWIKLRWKTIPWNGSGKAYARAEIIQ